MLDFLCTDEMSFASVLFYDVNIGSGSDIFYHIFVYGLFFSGHLAPVSLHLFIHSLHINKISLKYEHALRNGIYSKKECYQQMDQYCK